jgi:molybdopterin-guanine dinucleotide biosynthesis protein A
MSRVLGAILAGGRSSRFGADKALALYAGQPLIAHVVAALTPQVEALVVCGREMAGLTGVPDRPRPGLGPLGGLSGALHHAQAVGYDLVVTVGCDSPILPQDLVARLQATGASCVLASLPIVGLWPASLAGRLDVHLAESDDRSMRAWARRTRAALVEGLAGIANVNTPEDLARLAAPDGG